MEPRIPCPARCAARVCHQLQAGRRREPAAPRKRGGLVESGPRRQENAAAWSNRARGAKKTRRLGRIGPAAPRKRGGLVESGPRRQENAAAWSNWDQAEPFSWQTGRKRTNAYRFLGKRAANRPSGAVILANNAHPPMVTSSQWTKGPSLCPHEGTRTRAAYGRLNCDLLPHRWLVTHLGDGAAR